MNIAQTFGDTLSTLNIDTSNKDIPKTTIELVTNVLGNLQKKDTPSLDQPQSENFRFNNESTSSQVEKEIKKQPSSAPPSTSVWKILKVCIVLSTFFIILSLEFVKNFITRFTNNHIISLSILFVIFIMITFCSIKWFI
jgi:hypothetical protein